MSMKPSLPETLYIYDTSRYQHDFACIFPEAHIILLADSLASCGTNVDGKHVIELSALSPHKLESDHARVIVFASAPDHAAKVRALQAQGLAPDRHYLDGETLFPLLDKTPPGVFDRPCALWGSGHLGEEFLSMFRSVYGRDLPVAFWLDNDGAKRGTLCGGHPVRHPDDLSFNQPDALPYIVVTSVFYRDIKRQLEALGLEEHKQFTHCSRVLLQPSAMLRRVFAAPQVPGPSCPFGSTVEIRTDGIFPCTCAPHLRLPLGNLCADDMDSIWHSLPMKIFHLSLLNHTYCFCHLEKCFFKQMEPPVPLWANSQISVPKVRKLDLSLDETCNLYCKKCRHRPLGISPSHVTFRRNLLDSLLRSNTARAARDFFLAGGGELFASRVYDDFFDKEYGLTAERCLLVTNLQLFSLEKFKKIQQRFAWISLRVSIDGFTAQTYESIQRGASFERMRKNMDLACELRRQEKLKELAVTMVLQQDNAQEILPMVHWLENLPVDSLLLERIRNWGTFSDEEFNDRISLYDADLVHPKPAYRGILDEAAHWQGRLLVHCV